MLVKFTNQKLFIPPLKEVNFYMLLACNYSDELIELLKEDIVNVDYIKLGLFEMYKDVWEKALSIKPILLHGLGFNERASMKNINDVNWEYVYGSRKVCIQALICTPSN